MQNQWSFAVLLVGALAGAARAQDPAPGPKGPPTEFAAVRFGVAEGTLEVARPVSGKRQRAVTEIVPVTRKVVVSGKEVEKVENVPITLMIEDASAVPRNVSYRAADVQVLTTRASA
jgi:hypothetical protein